VIDGFVEHVPPRETLYFYMDGKIYEVEVRASLAGLIKIKTADGHVVIRPRRDYASTREAAVEMFVTRRRADIKDRVERIREETNNITRMYEEIKEAKELI
jgi:hypothetical protein